MASASLASRGAAQNGGRACSDPDKLSDFRIAPIGSRAFSEAAGVSPAKSVERLRVEAARERVEHGAEPIEIIAKAVGFSDPERMRRDSAAGAAASGKADA
jgi:methylphosphotriester-DNA--protein-cysteine methyltransferase